MLNKEVLLINCSDSDSDSDSDSGMGHNFPTFWKWRVIFLLQFTTFKMYLGYIGQGRLQFPMQSVFFFFK